MAYLIFKLKILLVSLILIVVTCALVNAKESNKIKIRVTDFWRSPQQQAYLLEKLKKKGVNLLSLYKDTVLITEVMKAENVEESELIIRKYMDQGIYLSKHLCGQAIDLAKSNGVLQLISFLKNSNDIEILDEGDHFHLQTTTECR